MKVRTMRVDVDESGDPPSINYVVSKLTVEEAETLGEAVNTIPNRVEVYNGADRVAAQQAGDTARQEMFMP